MFRLRPKYNCVYDSLLFTALRVISPWIQVVGPKAEQELYTTFHLHCSSASSGSAAGDIFTVGTRTLPRNCSSRNNKKCVRVSQVHLLKPLDEDNEIKHKRNSK